MSRLLQTFTDARARGERVLIPYLTGGYPTCAEFARHLRAAADAGGDILEMGIPFSDPIADGPVIQQSSQSALAAGATLPAILDAVRTAAIDRPLVAMSYLNPLLIGRLDTNLARLAAAGVCGLIVPDLPIDESEQMLAATAAHNIDLVFLAAPTSSDARLRRIMQASRSFVYAVSRTGTTGVQSGFDNELRPFLQRLRASGAAPIAVGFGVSTPAHVSALYDLADGVIVGSRLVQAIRDGEDLPGVIRALKAATRSPQQALTGIPARGEAC